MQSKLISSSTSLARLLFSSSNSKWQRFASGSTGSSGRTADPAVHAGRLDDVEAEEAEKSATAEEKAEHKPNKETETLVSPKLPQASSARLEHNPVNKPVEPIFQQKRHKSDTSVLDEVSCTALDESPCPEEREDMEKQRGEQEEDDKEYFLPNKASPLSMIEVADTRKPLTQATDGTAYSGYAGGDVSTVWRPEQIDTAEEALLRAAMIWKDRAESGDPDFPPSRILRQLREHQI